jgi:hypothetical protein
MHHQAIQSFHHLMGAVRYRNQKLMQHLPRLRWGKLDWDSFVST